jgi:hypothetical protein
LAATWTSTKSLKASRSTCRSRNPAPCFMWAMGTPCKAMAN